MKKQELTKLIKEVMLKEESSYSPIHLFMYFGWNFPDKFIESVWEGDDHLIEHFKSKFMQAYKSAGHKYCMFEFYSQLSGNNQAKLETWILKNYKG